MSASHYDFDSVIPETQANEKFLFDYCKLELHELKKLLKSDENAVFELIQRSPLCNDRQVKLSSVKKICKKKLKQDAKNPFYNYVFGLIAMSERRQGLALNHLQVAYQDRQDRHGYAAREFYALSDVEFYLGRAYLKNGAYAKGAMHLIGAIINGSSSAYSYFLEKRYIQSFDLALEKDPAKLKMRREAAIALSYMMFIVLSKNRDLSVTPNIQSYPWIDTLDKRHRDLVINIIDTPFDNQDITKSGTPLNLLVCEAIAFDELNCYQFVKFGRSKKLISDHLYYELMILLYGRCNGVGLKNKVITDLVAYHVNRICEEKFSGAKSEERHIAHAVRWIEKMESSSLINNMAHLVDHKKLPDPIRYALFKRFYRASQYDLALAMLKKIKNAEVCDAELELFFGESRYKDNPDMQLMKLRMYHQIASNQPEHEALRFAAMKEFGFLSDPAWEVNYLLKTFRIELNKIAYDYGKREAFVLFRHFNRRNSYHDNKVFVIGLEKALSSIIASDQSNLEKLTMLNAELNKQGLHFYLGFNNEVRAKFTGMVNQVINLKESLKPNTRAPSNNRSKEDARTQSIYYPFTSLYPIASAPEIDETYHHHLMTR